MKKNEIKKLEFSICLNECEEFSYVVDGEDISDDVSYEDVNDYIHSLVKKVKGFFIGEHRTYGEINYYEDNTMDIFFHDYSKPDWDVIQDHHHIKNVKTILPNF